MPITSYFFWFTQPATLLSSADKMLIYIFAVMVVLGVVVWIIGKLTRHTVAKKLVSKLAHLFFWTGLIGMIWGALRYESTPIFAQRYWAGLTLIVGILWLLWILKYLFFSFGKEKSEFDREVLRSKYLPKAK